MRKYIYIGVFLMCVLPLTWPTNWDLIWPDGWWKFTMQLPSGKSAEELIERKRPLPELKLGEAMLHIDPFDRMTFGEIVRIQKFPSADRPNGFILVYLKGEGRKIKKIPANHGTWINIEEILKQEYLENEVGWE